MLRGALALKKVDREATATDATTFGDWLDAHGQNAATRSAMWDLFTVATLNAPAAQASLALAATVFQIGLFSDRAAGDIGYSLVPLQELHGSAAAAALAAAGATVITSARVTSIAGDGGTWTVTERSGGERRVDRVVLAVPPAQAELLLPPGALALQPGWAERLGTSPIVNVHVVFDRAVLQAPFLAGVDTSVQWVFDRTAQSGLAEGQYLAVSLSAAADLVDLPTAELRRRILPELFALVPEARQAQVLDFFVSREREATFLPGAGTAASRPGARTAAAGVALAGAWTATGWPATMESAVRSGHAAAEVVLRAPIRRPAKGPVAA